MIDTAEKFDNKAEGTVVKMLPVNLNMLLEAGNVKGVVPKDDLEGMKLNRPDSKYSDNHNSRDLDELAVFSEKPDDDPNTPNGPKPTEMYKKPKESVEAKPLVVAPTQAYGQQQKPLYQ